MTHLKKILQTALVLIVFASMCSAQTMYFKLTVDADTPSITNGVATFSQPEIQNLVSGYVVQPVLPHPVELHSKYAQELARTYRLDISGMTENERASMVSDLETVNDIELAEYIKEAMLTSCPTNDPSDAPWNLHRHEITCVQEAHCITQGNPNISIAVKDNGYMAGHPELAGQVEYVEPGAYNGECHGTQSAISAAGATDNGFGISSSGFDCSLMLYQGLFAEFVGDYKDLADKGARIVTNSFAGCDYSTCHQDVINMITDMGVIVVASAGNGNGSGGHCGGAAENFNLPTFPSSYNNVISISSVDNENCCETTYNFWGEDYDPPLHHTHNSTVDFLAQGYGTVTGSCGGGGQIVAYGTSFSTPHVAGIVGLMLSVNPCLNHDDVVDILNSTGNDVSGVCNNQEYYPNGVPNVPCAEAAVLEAQNYVGPDLVIDEDKEWDQKFVSGNVIIKAGATLTIYGTASMATNSKIIVERNGDLIIDGGTLTACLDEWEGIDVEGDVPSGSQVNAGRVKLMNNAVIEHASNAISMNPNHLPWPEIADHWGGLVEADNSTIRNCGRAVEFMKYGNVFVEDESYFNNCTFENIESSAVTIWSSNHVTFTQCTFENIGESGILAFDSEVIVNDGCVFQNQPNGVDVLTTYPINYAPRIGKVGTTPNTFECSEYGVFSQSQGNITPLSVQNNNFLGGTYGMHINGFSNYRIRSNDFIGGEFAGVETVSTVGLHSNFITNNNISSYKYGSHAAFDNSNLEYRDNCFDFNGISDIVVNAGQIFIDQGSGLIENGNCFTKNGVPEIDNSGNDEINLYVWEGEPLSSCEYPTVVANNPVYNVAIKQAENFSDENCGSQFSPGNIDVRTFCEGPFETNQQILDKIEEVEQLIEDAEDNPELTPEYKEYLITIYQRCLDRLPVLYTKRLLDSTSLGAQSEDQRMDTAISYLKTYDKFKLNILAYGLMVQSNELSSARTYLNNLSTSNTDQSEFVTAQNINLDYLEDPLNYTLAASEDSTLYNIGRGSSPLDGFARSIYELLTGERIEIDIPDPQENPQKLSSSTAEEEIIPNVYPNPSKAGNVYIDCKNLDNECLTYRIYDLFGQTVSEGNIETPSISVGTIGWTNGVYIVKIRTENGEMLHTSKLLIHH